MNIKFPLKNKKVDFSNLLGFAILLIMVFLPLFIKSPYWLDIFITVLMYAFLGTAWNIVGGYCGQISFGHSAYFGLGAYISTILFIKFAISPWMGMIIAAIVVGLIAIIFGYPSLRLTGHYFVFFTIGFTEVTRIIFLNWKWAGAAMGIIIPYTPSFGNLIFFSKVPYYYIALLLTVLGVLFTYLIERSKLGKYFIAIREDQSMAEAIGINTAVYKTYAFAISAAMAAIGGVFYAQYVLYIHPDTTMTIIMATYFVLIPLVGGAGTIFGPVVGAAILIPLQEYARATFGGRIEGLSIVIIGLIIIIMTTTAPTGVMGLLKRMGYKDEVVKEIKDG